MSPLFISLLSATALALEPGSAASTEAPAGEVAAEEAPAEEAAAEEAPTEEAPAEEAAAEEVTEAPAEEVATEDVAVEEPEAEEDSSAEAAVEVSSVVESSVEEVASESAGSTSVDFRAVTTELDNFAIDAHGNHLNFDLWTDTRLRVRADRPIMGGTFTAEFDLLSGQVAGECWKYPGTDKRRRYALSL